MNKKFIVRQQDIRDCGICCLQSIIKFYGGFIPLETLRLDTKTNNNGTTAYNLILTAKKYGFNAIGRKNISLDSEELILPAIAHVVTDKGINHFVVIYKVTSKHLHIMDPAKGYVRLTKESFRGNWTNVILIFNPYKKIPLMKLNHDVKKLFISVLSNQKELLLKIVCNNIIITLVSIFISYYFKIVISSIDNDFRNTTIFIIILFLIFHILKIYFNYIKNELTIYLNKNIDLLIIPEFINHIFKLPLNIICSRTTGEILTRIKELDNIKALFSELFVSIILDLFLVVCSVFFLNNISNELFFILCIMVLLYMFVGFFINPIVLRKLNDNIDLETDFNSLLSEKIGAVESIKNLGVTNQVICSLENSYTKYQENTFNYSLFFNNFVTIKSIINDIGLFIISSYGVYLIMESKLTLLSLITFNTLLTYFIDPIEDCVDILPKFSLIKLSINKISEFLNIETENLGKFEQFYNGDIEFKNVKYSYNDIDEVVGNFNLFIPKKTHCVIIGHTGSGKSTLCKMINRNIDDYKGSITIGGVNVKDYSLNTLRKNILYVSQREKIFNDTILNNITLQKKISKKELNEILKITKVDEIIDKKAMRLESFLYDEGFNLSGGERQRIILARSLILKPEILILDESLSEIDRKTETEILEAIDVNFPNLTIIYISHTDTKCFKNIIEMGVSNV